MISSLSTCVFVFSFTQPHDREKTLAAAESNLEKMQNDLSALTLERDETLTELQNLQEDYAQVKREHVGLEEENNRVKDEVDRLKKDVATKQKDFAALQEGHLRDREVLHEKVSHLAAPLFL